MTLRIAASGATLGVAIATVTFALALGESTVAQPPAPAQDPTVTRDAAQPIPPTEKASRAATKAEVKVFKAAPAAKTGTAVEKAIAPAPLAVRKMAVPAAPFNADGQIQQYMQQFRPILRAEYHIVRLACRLTPDQRTAIARAGEQTLREAARKYSEMMHRPMTMAQRAALDPRKQIREGLAGAVKARLSGELAARYQEEIARREASRKQLAVRNLVARLDRDLVLSPGQRDKVAESLTSHWNDSWCQSIEMFMQDYQYLPPIPDQYVAPFLNDPQKSIWRGTQKVNAFWGGFGMMGGIMVDDPLEDDELRVAREEASSNDPKPEPVQPAVKMRGAVQIQVAPPGMMQGAMITTKAAKVQAPVTPKEAKKTPDTAKENAAPKP